MDARKLILLAVVAGICACPVLAAPATFSFDGQDFDILGQLSLAQTGTSTGGDFTVAGIWLNDGFNTYSGSPYVYVGLETWCVESAITFDPQKKYYFTVDPLAWAGGPGTGGSGVAIHAGSEWIYDQWRAGNLGAYTDTAISTTIHQFQGQGVVGDTTLYNAALAGIGSNTTANHTWALNLWELTLLNNEWQVADKQSQMVTVPAPGAILLAGIGTSIIGLLRRRRTI